MEEEVKFIFNELTSLFNLTETVAIVTGGSRGIGRSIAIRLAQHGAKVVVSSRNYESCDKVVKTIQNFGGEATTITCDLQQKEQLQNLVDQTNKIYGRIDSLVCNAGVNSFVGSSLQISDQDYEYIMNTNVRSNFWLSNMVVPIMKNQGQGNIIIISSIAGFQGSQLIGVYSMSKAAILQLVKNIAVEFGKYNIRANCIAPGLIKTDMSKNMISNSNFVDKFVVSTPLGRIGEPDEIAGAAVFLSSQAGSYITGQTIIIDGGRTAGSYLSTKTVITQK